MTTTPETIQQLSEHLGSLAGTHCRPEFGNQVFYVGGSQFAALTDTAVLMHLPMAELTGVLRRGVARPFVSAAAMGRNGWVEIPFGQISLEELERLLTTSHAAARHAHRRSRPRHPSRARRRGGPAPTT